MAYRVSESGIQTAIMAYLGMLKLQGKIYFTRNNSFSGQIERNDGYKSYIQNNNPGMPDILCCYKGQYVGIEVKSPSGSQTWKQKQAQREIEAAGGMYLLVRSVDEVAAVLR